MAEEEMPWLGIHGLPLRPKSLYNVCLSRTSVEIVPKFSGLSESGFVAKEETWKNSQAL
jgi:hypothetical protein